MLHSSDNKCTVDPCGIIAWRLSEDLSEPKEEAHDCKEEFEEN